MFDRLQHPRAMISGVCAWMSERSGVPVLMIRIVGLALLITHAPLMVIGYFFGAWMIRRRARAVVGGVPDRFGHLDRRMAEAEEAAWRAEYMRGR